jgi:hypothetical protein
MINIKKIGTALLIIGFVAVAQAASLSSRLGRNNGDYEIRLAPQRAEVQSEA